MAQVNDIPDDVRGASADVLEKMAQRAFRTVREAGVAVDPGTVVAALELLWQIVQELRRRLSSAGGS